MKVLVTYASAGAGHQKAAEAIYDYLKDNRRDLNLKLVDVLPFAGAFFRFCYSRGYPFLVHYAPWLWGLFFWMTEFRPTRSFIRKISLFSNSFSCSRFIRYLEDEDFDFIISTHFLNSELAAALKIKNKIKSKLVTVITDFGVHPFWVSPGTDIYSAASEFTKDALLKAGVQEPRVLVTGIPFSPKFTKALDKKILAEKLGVDPQRFTVLVMTGSFGSGPLEEIAEAIRSQAQVLLVCAKNKVLFKRLQKKNYRDVTAFGFIDNVEELMTVSDCIITKPGGLSISELLVKGLVPIFITAIPGQEENNAKILSGHGIGFMPKDIGQISLLVRELKNDPQRLKELRDRVKMVSKPYACQKIADVIR